MEEPGAHSQPRNSYRAGLVVVIVIAVAMVLTAGVVIAAPFGGEAGEAEASPTTIVAPTTTGEPPAATTLAPATTEAAVPTESIGAFVVQDGDCIALPAESLVETLESVPCAQPHDAEVYHAFDMADEASWPGNDAVIEAAVDGCLAAFQPFVGVAYEFSELDVYYLHPTEESWNQLDDREIVCLITALDGSTLTGSMQGSNR